MTMNQLTTFENFICDQSFLFDWMKFAEVPKNPIFFVLIFHCEPPDFFSFWEK